MINVTKPFLPDIEEYITYVRGIWDRNWLTNNGPLVNDLELRLKEYLNVKHLLYLGNGTIALQIAIKALGLTGEIITTPFSYVATTTAIAWEGCEPVFADIDKDTFNIDPAKIEQAITNKTTGILATHVFGNPCDIDAIQKIADKHNLKVIYDAAHCFGTQFKGKSVYNYGDISTASFHATKLFHTIEGGAVMTNNADLLKKMAYMRNFGHETAETFAGVGINGKNSEFHAAMGLANLRHIEAIQQSRKDQAAMYDKELAGLRVKRPKIQANSVWNHSYYPVVFETEELLLRSITELNDNWIYPRRYFYPSLSGLNYVKKYAVPVSDDVCRRVLCLPLFYELENDQVKRICQIIGHVLRFKS